MEEAETMEPNVRHNKYFIVESKIACAACERVTVVFAFSLPAGYESFIVNDDDPPAIEDGHWEVSALAAVLSYVDYLPQSVANRIQAVTSRYSFKANEGRGGGLWVNCCEHCGEMMDEEDLHGDLDSPFGPMPAQGLESVQPHLVREPFEARVGGESHDVKPLQS